MKSATKAGDINSEVFFESAVPDEVVSKLRGVLLSLFASSFSHDVCMTEMGHDAYKVEGFGQGMMGRGQVIQKLGGREGRLVWAAGSDQRADGHAVAQI